MLSSAPPSSLLVSVRLLLLLLVLAEVAASSSSSSCPLAAAVSVAQSSVLVSISPPVSGQQMGLYRPAEMACCYRAEKLVVGRVGGIEGIPLEEGGRGKSWFWDLRLDYCSK